MTDIYDIKLDYFAFIMDKNYLIFVGIIIFIIFFYLLLSKILIILNSTQKDTKQNISKTDLVKSQILESFNKLKNNFETLPKQVFCTEFIKILKNIINIQIKNDLIYTMTFTEFDKKYKTNYNEIYKNIYYFEFNNNTEDNTIFRQNLLENLEKTDFFKN